MGRTAAMNLDIHAESFSQVGNLHRSGDAEIDFRICAQQIGRFRDNPVCLGFDASDMFGNQQRGFNFLAQFAVGGL